MRDLLPLGMMELSQAACAAYQEVFASFLRRSPDDLDVVATALATHVEVYGTRTHGGDWMQLQSRDLASGVFRCGATRFEYADGRLPFVRLAVRSSDFARALEELRPPVT